MRTVWPGVALLFVGLSSGCSTKSSPPPAGPSRPATGACTITSRSIVWVSSELAGGGWQRLHLRPLEIRLPPNLVAAGAGRQHAAAFQEAFEAVVSDAYPLVDTASAGTLVLAVQVVNRTSLPMLLQRAGEGPLTTDGRVRSVALEVRAMDGATGRPVAASINEFEGPLLASSLRTGDVQEALRAFLPFARRVRMALDQTNLRQL